MKLVSRRVKRLEWQPLPWRAEQNLNGSSRFHHSHPLSRISRVGAWKVGVDPVVIYKR